MQQGQTSDPRLSATPHAWCVEMDGGQIVCFARQGCAELRKRYPEWVVYSFEDAACIREYQTSRYQASIDSLQDEITKAQDDIARIESSLQALQNPLTPDEIAFNIAE